MPKRKTWYARYHRVMLVAEIIIGSLVSCVLGVIATLYPAALATCVTLLLAVVMAGVVYAVIYMIAYAITNKSVRALWAMPRAHKRSNNSTVSRPLLTRPLRNGRR